MSAGTAQRIVIVGGGIAGVETALTLALGLPAARISVLSEWPALRLLPNLVYVPVGMSPRRLDIPLQAALGRFGVELVAGTATAIDRARRSVTHDGGELAYDDLVLCPGTHSEPTAGHALRTLDDALGLRATLEALDRDRPHSIVVRELPGSTWFAPGYEIALLIRAWLVSRGMASTRVTVVTSDSSPLLMFDLNASELVHGALAELGIELLRGLPADRVEAISGDIDIDFGRLAARRVAGFDPVGGDGFYDVRSDGSTSAHHFVVGDAANVPYKAAFATSWQARRVLRALGGDVATIGETIDDVPSSQCEYQMDLFHRTLVVRFGTDARFTGHSADLRAHAYARSSAPDKLQGTLVRQLLIGEHRDAQVARRFHEVLDHELSGQRAAARAAAAT